MATLHHHRPISSSVLPPLSRLRRSSAIPAMLFARPPLSGLLCASISAPIRDKRVLGPVRGCTTSDSAISPGPPPPSSRIFIKGIHFVSLVGYKMDSKPALGIRTIRV
ncbi:hypothetical protein B296_00035910 [Ensete ventricosum]|uniref:Uncharacterized protein n=1 Tax=Ensete ventricosum TaxID=4639 RepID=A0A426X3H5_ENSVE|nr:hypothetical protein B296_00035910 [Ensete ventricosum]